MLDAALDPALDPALADRELAAWRANAERLASAVGWESACTIRRRGARAALALTAPIDALMSATLVNEWAWIRATSDATARAPGAAPSVDRTTPSPEADEPRLPASEAAAVAMLREQVAAERNVKLVALAARAAREGVSLLFDEERASIGGGATSETFALADLPGTDAVEWKRLHDIPVALVTGSNGKTTTVRLVAAMLANAGQTVGFCCSDGVFIAGERVERGDWSGPAGARRVLRDPRVTAAVIEAARGGLLRRGLAVSRANAAVITNIAHDHFGGYGIHSLEDLAEAKLVVARALGAEGTLVLNRDDATLGRAEHRHTGPVAWFGPSSLPDWVPVATDMPLTVGGHAKHNHANIAGAVAVARALQVPQEAIVATLKTFGADNADNPGRLERFERNGVRIWVDYAHNPHGLSALLGAAAADHAGGRLGLLLGQAGDREDGAIRALARVAWESHPDHIVLKDLDGYLRGRSRGEVPALLREELIRAGASEETLDHALDETDGAHRLLAWARPGDLLVMPVHALEARERAIALIRDWAP